MSTIAVVCPRCPSVEARILDLDPYPDHPSVVLVTCERCDKDFDVRPTPDGGYKPAPITYYGAGWCEDDEGTLYYKPWQGEP